MRRHVLLSSALVLAITAPAAVLVRAEDCGNCFGAGDPGQCCNTCDEVIAAYKKKRWGFKRTDFGQCRDEDAKTGAATDESDKIAERLKRQVEEQQRREAEEEKKKEATTDDPTRQAAADRAKKQAEEFKRNQEDTRRAAEEKKKADEDARRRADEEKRQAEEAKRREDEQKIADAKRQAEERQRAADAKRQADEQKRAEAQRQAEERQRADAAKQQADEQKRAEAQRQAEERQRAADAKRQADEQKRAEAQKQKQAEIARKQAEAKEELKREEAAKTQTEAQQKEATQGEAADKSVPDVGGDAKPEVTAEGGSAAAAADDVVSRVTNKLHELGGDSPIIDRAGSAMHMLQDGARTVAHSRAGQAAGEAAQKVYDQVSAKAGEAAQRVYDEVSARAGETVHKLSGEAAEVLSGVATERSWPVLFVGAVAILFVAASVVTVCTCLYRRRSRRRYGPKEKADLDYTFTPGSVEEGACLKGDDKSQPFQLYHEFEYTMRRRYNSNSYTPSQDDADDDDKYNKRPTGVRSPPQSFTYRQSIHSDDGQPLLVSEPVQYKLDKKDKVFLSLGSVKTLGMGILSISAVVYLGGRYLMPADMSFGEMWLATAEYVDQHVLGHHGLVL